MTNDKRQSRALRYRKLAMAEPDNERASLLMSIADEAERGILCTVDQLHHASANKRS